MIKRILIITCCLLLVACGGSDEPEPTPTERPEPTPRLEPTNTPAPETITLLSYGEPQVAQPLRRHAETFEAETGIRVIIEAQQTKRLYDAIQEDNLGTSTAYAGYVFPGQWLPDLAEAGYLEPLTEQVEQSSELDWDDILPAYRDYASSYDGEVYSIPLDGDVLLLYYRQDIFDLFQRQPPRTWDEYLALARAVNRIDMNGDGFADYGSCMAKGAEEQGFWYLYAIAGTYLQTQGPDQGVFFDAQTFEPRTQNPAFERALGVYQESARYGPPDELNIGVRDTRAMFLSGRCAMTIDWPELGLLAANEETSAVTEGFGTAPIPGSTQVLNTEANFMASCQGTELCPLALENVNYAPYMAFGGWMGAVSSGANGTDRQHAFDFLAYASAIEQSQADVVDPLSGFNPYRESHLTAPRVWRDAGFTDDTFTEAIAFSLSSNNIMLDLRVPQSQQYQQATLDPILTEFLTSTRVSARVASENLFNEWEALNEDLGRGAQFEVYLKSLEIE